MGILLLIVILVLCFGANPRWGYHSYGYAPMGGLGFILLIIVILLFLGRL